jgi:multidrug efflux pump
VNALIDATLSRPRTIISLLVLILIAGTVSYMNIPKESDPDIDIPIIYVSMSHEGISPDDAERLLIRPMEQELKSIEGVKEMTSTAVEGNASIVLEFDAGFDSDAALTDVREKVDIAKSELPADTDEPTVNEVNVALFPVLVVTLYGDVAERLLVKTARDLRDHLESLPGILEVDIAGDREDLVEVLIDPVRAENYQQSQESLVQFISRNNELVAAGALDTGQGRFAIKVPGLFESVEDILDLPIVVSGDSMVRFVDVATANRRFKDPVGFARVNGQPAVALEVSKRIGTNIIDTIADVRRLVEEAQGGWPPGVKVLFSQDKSNDIRDMLYDLQNNVIAAVVLVMIVIVAFLGVRAAGLVGLAIPGSFLAGILVIASIGLTVNVVVLFSLIMSVGMLVDGAIVVVELADRKMAEGLPPSRAYAEASNRMAWPIVAATATTLAAFLPLLFWPGIVGEFMKYLPITLIATLSASLFMALIFVPTLGALIGKRAPDSERRTEVLVAAEEGDLGLIGGGTGYSLNFLRLALQYPKTVAVVALAVLAVVYAAYGAFGKGVEFFPDVEPENAVLQVRARGDLSVYERDRLVREVEERILDMNEFASIYARSGTSFRAQVSEDAIGLIQLELVDWKQRRPAKQILAEVRERLQDLAGIVVEAQQQESGPPVGKPVQIQVGSRFPELLAPAIGRIRAALDDIGGFVDVGDSRPIPGIEWQLKVDRAEAARYGADIATVGSVVQLVTNGVRVGSYRPADTEDEVEIRVRYPSRERSIDQLDRLRIPSQQGAVPLSNFVTRLAKPRVGTINRSDGRRVMAVEADVEEGLLPDVKVREIKEWLAQADFDPRLEFTFKGEDQEQREAETFLLKAFGVALFVMAIILVTQFNSFYQASLILSAVIFSTIGVLLGLMITGQPFGIVMSGVGVIALAGIVVNNNIVLIDTYNLQRRRGRDPVEAVLRTGALRLRPVLLTTATTILGLLPMVLGVNIDFIGREITVGGPSTQWWTQLATAVAGGLAFATVLTLVMTPCLLVLGERLRRASPGREMRGIETG